MKEKSKAKIKAILFPDISSNGNQPLYIRIYLKAKSSYINTGYSIPSGAFNKDKSEVWENMPSLTIKMKKTFSKEELKAFREKQKGIILLPNAFKINSDCRAIITNLEEIIKKLEVEKQEISSEILKNLYEGKDKNENARKDFLLYIKEVADKKYQSKQIRTSEKYNVMLKKLKKFRKNKPLPIDELTTELLNDFKLHLIKEGSHQNYVHVNLKALRTIIQKEAIREDKIIAPDKNPFLFFTMPKVLTTTKERLTIEEIEKIESLEIAETEMMFHVRNIFLFSFYNAGIRIGDLLQLKWTNIKEGRLKYSMNKTDEKRSIKLLPQALNILKYYEAKKVKDTDFIFPMLDNNAEYSKFIEPEDFNKAKPELLDILFAKIESRIAECNRVLKDLAKRAKIEKKITNHISRHSFADIAREKKISVYDIQQMLGHSKISVTQKYLKELDIEGMDNSMESVFKK